MAQRAGVDVVTHVSLDKGLDKTAVEKTKRDGHRSIPTMC